MDIRIAKDPSTWNKIVDKSPYSVLHHRYEVCRQQDNALPLVIEEQNHSFLFPVSIVNLFHCFRLAVSPIYYHASILPDDEGALDLMPTVLDEVISFLREMNVDYFCTCAPTFWSMKYVDQLRTWCEKNEASLQTIYAHMIKTENKSFEEIWKHRFEKHARNQARKAEKEGVEVIKIDTIDDINEWIEGIYQCNLSALDRQGRLGAYPDGYKEIYLSELLSTKKLLKDCFHIYGAKYRNRLVAYMAVIEYNKLMQITKAMSQTKFLAKCPNDALVAYVVKEACERGFEWVQYSWDRVKRGGKITSLYASLQNFKFKFGFEEIPIFIYRFGLNRRGAALQRLYVFREYVIARSASFPQSIRKILLRFYFPRRRSLFAFSHV